MAILVIMVVLQVKKTNTIILLFHICSSFGYCYMLFPLYTCKLLSSEFPWQVNFNNHVKLAAIWLVLMRVAHLAADDPRIVKIRRGNLICVVDAIML